MIRAASPQDAEAVAAIWNHHIRSGTITFNAMEKSLDEVRSLMAARQRTRCFLVAEDQGRVCGFATYDQFRTGVGYAHAMEHTIQLAPDALGHGFGRALMACLETHARAAGVHVMVAAIAAENPAGQAFHAALGYAEVGRMPQVGRKRGRWLDLVLMQKILS